MYVHVHGCCPNSLLNRKHTTKGGLFSACVLAVSALLIVPYFIYSFYSLGHTYTHTFMCTLTEYSKISLLFFQSRNIVHLLIHDTVYQTFFQDGW